MLTSSSSKLSVRSNIEKFNIKQQLDNHPPFKEHLRAVGVVKY